MNNTKKADVGVIIGRFQVHKLHEAHHAIIKEVVNRHDKVIIFIGISPVKCTRKNPLDYKCRELMISTIYPDLTILPIYDVADDKEWSNNIDDKIKEIYPIESVLLYGSRDGFIPYYHGCYNTIELESRHNVSGTEIRKELSNKTIRSEDFRHGIVYSAFNKYPVSHTTVDAAIYDDEKGLLLCRKRGDEKNKYRFIGGFVDINKDNSLESAIKREAAEETNSLGIGEPEYIGSCKIDDWRYKDEIDGIMTSLFKIKYTFGLPEPKDDINELSWFKLNEIENTDIIIKEHIPLFKLFIADYKKRQERTKNE